MTTRSKSKKVALQDEGKIPETCNIDLEAVTKPFTRRPLRKSRGKSVADVSHDEANAKVRHEECDKKTDGTDTVKKETYEEEDTRGGKIKKKTGIQKNKTVCSSTISQDKSHGQLSSESKSITTLTVEADKSGFSHPLHANDSTSLITSDKPILKEKCIESKDVNAINRPLGNLVIKEGVEVLQDKDIGHIQAEDSKVQSEMLSTICGKEEDKQCKVPEINISLNTTNKSAETSTDNPSSKNENRTRNEHVKAGVNSEYVVCGEKNIWISGLDGGKTRASDLKALFSKNNCRVISAKIITNAKSFGKQFYGFVTMASSQDALTCIQHFNKTELHGRTISIEQTAQCSSFSRKKIMKLPIMNQNATKNIGNNTETKNTQKDPVEEKNNEVNEIVKIDKVSRMSAEGKNIKPEAPIAQDETQNKSQDETHDKSQDETQDKSQDETQDKSQDETQDKSQDETQVEVGIQGGTRVETQDETQIILQNDEKQIIPVVEKEDKALETNGEMVVEETPEISEIKSEDGVVEEKMMAEKKDIHPKEREIHSRDRSPERRRAYRSRSRSRGYMMRDSRRDAREFRPRYYGRRRPFTSPHFLMEEMVRHDRFRDMERHRHSRRDDDRRARDIARKNREDSFKIKEEKERLRIEKEKLERMRADVLRKEREQQRAEREKLEQERAELRKRSQLTDMNECHGLKRSLDEHGENDHYWEEKKRISREPHSGFHRYGEFSLEHPDYPGRADRFEDRPEEKVSLEFNEPKRQGHPGAEETLFPRGNSHDSPESKPRERAFDQPHHSNFSRGRGHNFDRLHPWEGIQNDRQSNKFGPSPPVPHPWRPVRKGNNWGHREGHPRPPGPPQGLRPGLEHPLGRPPINRNYPPNMRPPGQLHPTYGRPRNELHGNMPGNFPGPRFNAIRRF